MIQTEVVIIIIIHGLGRLACFGIVDALPSFPGTSAISSPSRFVVEGVLRTDVTCEFNLLWLALML
jgi:hypothetical protein